MARPPDPGPPESPDPPAPPAAWRLTFEYDGSEVRLVGQQRVATMAPPDDSDVVSDDQVGYRVVVRDEDGAALYRRTIHDPIQNDMEVFSPQPGAPIERVPVANPAGAFQVIVPDLAHGVEVALHGPEPTETRARMSRRPLVTARLGQEWQEGQEGQRPETAS